MENLYSRTEMLIGERAVEKLRSARVLVCGVGGVGGYVVEALVRAGVGTIGILDNGTLKPSNLNRQILATTVTLGMKKVDAARKRIALINPSCTVKTYDVFYLPDTANGVDIENYDFIIDAMDTVTAKLELIVRAKRSNVKIVSSMGTGNKLKPVFCLDDIYKTTVCPLAKVMRKELKARGIESLPVLFSTEVPKGTVNDENGRHAPGSISYVPAVAGLTLAGYVLEELIK